MTRNAKALAWIGIVVLNVFFVYFCLLKGYQKGLAWQQVYLASSIVQGLFEIFFCETLVIAAFISINRCRDHSSLFLG